MRAITTKAGTLWQDDLISRVMTNMVMQVFASGFNYWMMILLARRLGIDLYGQFAFGYGAAIFCLFFVNLGGDQLIVREVAQFQQRDLTGLHAAGVQKWFACRSFVLSLVLALGLVFFSVIIHPVSLIEVLAFCLLPGLALMLIQQSYWFGSKNIIRANLAKIIPVGLTSIVLFMIPLHQSASIYVTAVIIVFGLYATYAIISILHQKGMMRRPSGHILSFMLLGSAQVLNARIDLFI